MTELAAALQAESAAERWRALVQFNYAASLKTTDPAILASLTRALADEHAFVRWQAGLALVEQSNGRQKLVELLKNYPASPPEFTSTGAELKTDLMCAAAIDVLAEKKSVDAQAYLVKSLSSSDARVRQSAAEALGKLGQGEAVPWLIAALKDSDLWVRRAAAIGLGHLRDARAAAGLSACLKDKAVIVRRSAAYALGALRAEAALPALKISLADPDPQVRRNSAWALGRIGRSEVVAALTPLLDDNSLNGAVATAASEAIATLTQSRWQQWVVGLGKRLKQ